VSCGPLFVISTIEISHLVYGLWSPRGIFKLFLEIPSFLLFSGDFGIWFWHLRIISTYVTFSG
jgi:hypothetical protein